MFIVRTLRKRIDQLRALVSRTKLPDIIISDQHIGTSMWQAAMLKAVGKEVEVNTLSHHLRYAEGAGFTQDRFFLELENMSLNRAQSGFAKKSRWSRVKCVVCSFPPSRVEALEKLPAEVSILLNIGHRIHIHVAPSRLVEFTHKIRSLAHSPRCILATMSEYDYHYVRYYTGLELLRLPVVAAHVPRVLREGTYAPIHRTVLIGPSHNTSRIIGFNNDLVALNQASMDYAVRHGLEPYRFDFIKSIYPGDQATVQNLSKHPAILMNPYSAFSISMVELYHLNLPVFVPADELLVDAMDDVRLHPIYQSKEAVQVLETAFPTKGTGYPCSPNDTSPKAQRYWLKYMYFNQVRHCQRWARPAELFEKLYRSDLALLHDEMRDENRRVFSEQCLLWKALASGGSLGCTGRDII